MNDHDVRMRKARDGLRFAQEPLARRPSRRLACRRLVQELERDLAVELGIEGRVNLAHPATADEIQDHVAADRGARRQAVRPGYLALQQGPGGAGRIPTGHRRDQIGAGRTARDVTLHSASADLVEAPVDEGKNHVFIETGHCKRRLSDRPCRVFSLEEPPG